MSWQTTICNEVNGLLNSESMSDVKLTVGKEPNRKVFRSHKLLLGIFSEVFKSMLFDSLAEKKNEIELPEDDPDAFQIMLNYIYMGEDTTGDVQIMIKVCRLAEKYQILQLKRNCVRHLKEDISAMSAIQIYEMANELRENELKSNCWLYIHEYADQVLSSENIINSSLETIQSIISNDNINVPTELDIYNAVLRWGKEKCKREGQEMSALNIRKVIEPCLSEIRFLTMTIEEFLTGPGADKLLTYDEQLSIIRNIVLRGLKEIPELGNGTKHKRCYVYQELTAPENSDDPGETEETNNLSNTTF